MKAEIDNRFHLGFHLKDAAQLLPLSQIPLNRIVRIEHLEGPREDCDRLLDLGLTPGEEVVITHSAPLGEPVVVRVRGALLALRKREAAWILVNLA